MTFQFIDGVPTAMASKGMIRLALRASDINGVDRIVGELAMSPNIASYLVIALNAAIAEHNGAVACNVSAFSAGKRRSRRNPKP